MLIQMVKSYKKNFCPKCGTALHGTEQFCGRCGYGLHHSPYQANPRPKESSNSTWIIVCVLIIIVLGIIVFSPEESNPYNNRTNPVSRLVNSELTQGEIQSIKNIDEMRKAIDNTIWTYTETGNLFWYKLVFKGNKVKIYSAMPSDGRWKFDEECSYTLEEGRYFDDGRRYIAAVFTSKDIDIPAKFTITNGHLYMLGFDIAGFVLGDYEWD